MMDNDKQLQILFLCNRPNVGNDANTIVDHIDAFEKYSKQRIWIYSNLGDLSPKLDLSKFDVIVIHYSICVLNNYYLSRSAKKRIREYTGLKVIFVQDEYRQINNMIQQLEYLGVDILFTCFPESEIEKIYPKEKLPKVVKFNNLTGYVPDDLLRVSIPKPSIAERKIDVGYRGRRLAYWYGELAYEKWSIVDKWKEHVSTSQLKFDISYNERDRIYGKNWINFLTQCKATLGVESGASVMDFTGNLEKEIDLYQLKNPQATFYQVQELFLKNIDGKYKLNQISPRCFEAIALKTTLVLYEGDYSNILIPNQHYIPLKKDFSNIKEVVAKLQDNDFLQELADRAYNQIAYNKQYSYKNFVSYFDKVVQGVFERRNYKAKLNVYNVKNFAIDVNDFQLNKLIINKFMKLYQKLPQSAQLILKLILKPSILFSQLKKSFYKFYTYATCKFRI